MSTFLRNFSRTISDHLFCMNSRNLGMLHMPCLENHAGSVGERPRIQTATPKIALVMEPRGQLVHAAVRMEPSLKKREFKTFAFKTIQNV